MPLPAWLDRFVSAGIVNSDPQVARRQKIVNIAAIAGSLNAASRVLSGFFYEAEGVLLMQGTSVFFLITGVLIHRLHRISDNAGAIGLVVWFMASATLAAVMFGLQSLVQIYFVLGGIIWLLFGIENWRLGAVALIALIVNLLAVMNYVSYGGAILPAGSPAGELLAVQSVLNATLINTIVLFYAVFLVQRAEEEMTRQTRRAEALLNVVLPERIAERLRTDPERQIADRIEGSTILFADLEGFTLAAHSEPPEKVVAYLDRLVREFDGMCESLGVDKIKSIGDAYMAAGGLRGDPRNGAIAIGRLALSMLQHLEQLPPLGPHKLRLRVGIHTGPAIAGVIGDTRISYDLWGDAVNVASRMESHGVPGRVHVSEAYQSTAGDSFRFEERGETEIKGIGIARTYFLAGLR
jgi:adenylate cyclase